MVKRGIRFLGSVCLSLAVLIVSHSGSIFGSAPDQEAGVRVISNPQSPRPPGGKAKRIRFQEELTIGIVEGDENYMFGNSIFFNTDEEGNFYVTDWDRKRIQKYSPEGKFLLTMGRKGQGPGEFGNLSIPRFDSQKRLYVTDIVNRRIDFFDLNGNFLEHINTPDGFGDLYINSRGNFVSGHSRRADSEGGGMAFKFEWGIFDRQFKPVCEFFSRVFDPKPPESRDLAGQAKFMGSVLSDSAFRPQPFFIVADDDLVYFGMPEKYVIDVYSPDGQKIKSIRREYDPIEITKKDRDWFEKMNAETGLLRGLGEIGKEALKYIKYPEHKPAYSSFALMENGWLAVVVESIQNEYALFDLFDKDGIYIGHFKENIPADSLFFKNGKAYGIDTQNGYKFAKRYGMEIADER